MDATQIPWGKEGGERQPSSEKLYPKVVDISVISPSIQSADSEGKQHLGQAEATMEVLQENLAEGENMQ